jgi:hypothetical protein
MSESSKIKIFVEKTDNDDKLIQTLKDEIERIKLGKKPKLPTVDYSDSDNKRQAELLQKEVLEKDAIIKKLKEKKSGPGKGDSLSFQLAQDNDKLKAKIKELEIALSAATK